MFFEQSPIPFIGTIYPSNIKRGEILEYYEQKLSFKIIEINATYYTIPSPTSFEGMIKKTSPDFEFTIKEERLTADPGYFRFHDRNPNWFNTPISERYDYLYTNEEL
ncbi:MAG TPA: DUF72 domain-containing protein [Candidatus Brocadiaceae bacterium]